MLVWNLITLLRVTRRDKLRIALLGSRRHESTAVHRGIRRAVNWWIWSSFNPRVLISVKVNHLSALRSICRCYQEAEHITVESRLIHTEKRRRFHGGMHHCTFLRVWVLLMWIGFQAESAMRKHEGCSIVLQPESQIWTYGLATSLLLGVGRGLFTPSESEKSRRTTKKDQRMIKIKRRSRLMWMRLNTVTVLSCFRRRYVVLYLSVIDVAKDSFCTNSLMWPFAAHSLAAFTFTLSSHSRIIWTFVILAASVSSL